MGADEDGCVPVVALRWLTRRCLWLDVNRFTCLSIDACQIPLLRLRIDNIGVAGLSGWLVSVSTQKHEPVRRTNAAYVICSRGPTLSVVVLSTAVNIVKRLSII